MARTPRTEILRTTCELDRLAYGEKPAGMDEFLSDLSASCGRIGFPCFVRTGHTSGKHQWSRTCCVESASLLVGHVSELVEYSNLVDMMGLPTSVWVVREMLSVESPFTAFRGLPISRERRYFIEGGEVRCHHPYWPAESLVDTKKTISNWRYELEKLNRHGGCGAVLPLARLPERSNERMIA